ncbi:MAG: type II secretion system F family protein, partial [Planctomycetota bacterium]
MAKKSGGGGGVNVSNADAPAKKKRGGILPRGLSQKDLTAFTRQFATLMDAGLPVVRSMDILERQLKPGLLKDAIGSVKEDVEGGASLSEAMDAQPRVFNDLYVNMIRAGEAGGVLDTILSRLAEFREKSQRLQRRIIGALVYPAVVIFIASAILIFIIAFIIPKFEEMFANMGGKLPAITMLLLTMSRFISGFWYVLIGIPIMVIVLYKLIYMNPKGAYIMDTIKMHIPVFGVIISKSSISRFTRTLGTLIESGVPILD